MNKDIELYILRHGIADEKGSRYPDDSKRPLVTEGKNEVKKLTKALKHLDLKLDVILSSPYKRAAQTAEIVAENLKMEKKLKYTPLLASDNYKAFLKELKTLYGKNRKIMVVGHEPYLSSLMSLLVFRRPMRGIRLKKAGMAKLTFGKKFSSRASLNWLLTPRQMALMSPAR